MKTEFEQKGIKALNKTDVRRSFFWQKFKT